MMKMTKITNNHGKDLYDNEEYDGKDLVDNLQLTWKIIRETEKYLETVKKK